MSTFHGLEMAKQALFTQQMGLYTTGHNISNVNTEGYSRQRVNFETLSPYPSASRNRPEMPGQIGQGVKAGTVQRMRDSFLDMQYRSQSSRASYWETKTDALSRMEGVMNEISGGDGLNKVLDDFWKSLQGLSTNPTNTGAREVVAQKGLAVAETFNYLSNSLENIKSDLKTQIGDKESGKIGDANSLLNQIEALNKQIGEIEPHGYLPNDLYDQRDNLIDQLSQIVEIKVDYVESGGKPLSIADGIAEISLADGTKIIDREGKKGEFSVSGTDKLEVEFDGAQVESEGSLSALIESHNTAVTNLINDLDKMANNFAEKFNVQHKAGSTVNDEKAGNFFEEGKGAKGITVTDAILGNPDLIAASSTGKDGDGANALRLGEIITDAGKSGLGDDTSLKSFYQRLTGKLAVQNQEAARMATNTAIQQTKVQNDRLSVSAVSLDEEMTNLLKFQHAYNASARSMTAMDELLDKIINSMGLVGR